jgi:hypothetical protein
VFTGASVSGNYSEAWLTEHGHVRSAPRPMGTG